LIDKRGNVGKIFLTYKERRPAMKKLGVILAVIVLVICILVLTKGIIAKSAVSAGVKAMTGLKLSMKSMNVGILKTMVGIKDLKLYNPPGFTDKLMVNMPEIYVDYDLGAFLKKKIHLNEVRINLDKLTVVKNEKGELNLDALTAVQKGKEKRPEAKKEKGPAPEFAIDVLQLHIGKVIYKDYSRGGEPKVREYPIEIHERFENITDPQALANVILVKALMNTTIGRLANFDLGPLKDGVSETLRGATGVAKEAAGKAVEVGKEVGGKVADTAKDAAEKGAEVLKDVLPFGE